MDDALPRKLTVSSSVLCCTSCRFPMQSFGKVSSLLNEDIGASSLVKPFSVRRYGHCKELLGLSKPTARDSNFPFSGSTIGLANSTASTTFRTSRLQEISREAGLYKKTLHLGLEQE